jgi:diguanylate cyclase (GGDEF)-like protein
MPDSQYIATKEVPGHRSPIATATGSIRRDSAYFNDRLSDEIARSKRYKYSFSILFIELDNMDTYAMKYGKEAEQEQLKRLRAILADSSRNTDIICHFAGCKFGVILPYCTSMQARIVAERIRGNIARIFMPASLSSNIRLTGSVGFAAYPDDALSRELLVTGGTYALSMAMAKGGNCTCQVSEPPEPVGHSDARKRLDEMPFMQFIGEEIARCSRYGHYFSIALLSIKRADVSVKQLENDVSPESWHAVNKRLNETLRGTDRCFPYAVNKWAVLLSNTGPENAQICAQKLLRSLEAGSLTSHNGKDVKLFTNIGISSFPVDDVCQEGLLDLAEVALDKSCKSGVNQFKLASALPDLPGNSDRDVLRWIGQLKGARKGSVYALLSAVDVTENYPRPHSHTVARYAVATGQVLGLPGNLLRQLRIVGQMHDIGKKCIPVSLITKPGPLDSMEWEIMRKHAQYGAAMLEQFPDLSICAPAVLAHHERWDGKGYPRGLKGDKIPLEARIISVAEAYDDMITKRPYKQAMPIQHALEELSRNSGTQFDPTIAKAFITTTSALQEI